MFASYATVPVYANFFRWLGHGDAIAEMCEKWAAKDRQGRPRRRPGTWSRRRSWSASRRRSASASASSSTAGVTLPVLLPITTPDRAGDVIEALGP